MSARLSQDLCPKIAAAVLYFSLALCLAAPAAVRASCGSASCPIETRAFEVPAAGRWVLDLSFQSIDQDRPRIGTHSAGVGEIPSEHDEIRTLNRTWTLNLRYAVSERLHLGVSLPWVSRFHEHREGEEQDDGVELAHEGHVHEWSLAGSGDLAVEASTRLWSPGPQGALWLTGAIELPTGADNLRGGEEEAAELPIQPGSGSTDATVGLLWRGKGIGRTAEQGVLGSMAEIPWFASVSFRRNGEGRDRYRLGDEWQAGAGGTYPLTSSLQFLGQLNARHRGEDSPGDTEEDTTFTGGTYVYASPGLRLAVASDWAGYLYVQIPVYQDVNRLQLTSNTNWFAGIQARF